MNNAILSNKNKFRTNEKELISNQFKKLNFVLIKNDKIVVIFCCLQAKLQLFRDSAQASEKFFGSR